MRGTNSISFQSFPQQRIRLVRISDFHAIDLHKYKVVQFVGHDRCIQLRNDLSYSGRLSGPRGARYIDASSSAFVDSSFQVGED